MKLIFISDIHGNYVALEKCLNIANPLQFDKICLLGDILGDEFNYLDENSDPKEYYDSNKVANILNNLKSKIIGIRGNSDIDSDLKKLDFDLTAKYKILESGSEKMFLTHYYNWNIYDFPFKKDEGITTFIHGHTHDPILYEYKTDINNEYNIKKVFNPGSISLPRGNNKKSFGYFDGKDFKHIYLN